MEWNIGKKAREIDSKSLKERLKVEKRTIKRIIIAFCFYILIMIILAFLV